MVYRHGVYETSRQIYHPPLEAKVSRREGRVGVERGLAERKLVDKGRKKNTTVMTAASKRDSFYSCYGTDDITTNEKFFYFCEMVFPWGIWATIRLKTNSPRPASFIMVILSVVHLCGYTLLILGKYKR